VKSFLTLRWGPTPSACQRSLIRSRRLIVATFRLVSYQLAIRELRSAIREP